MNTTIALLSIFITTTLIAGLVLVPSIADTITAFAEDKDNDNGKGNNDSDEGKGNNSKDSPSDDDSGGGNDPPNNKNHRGNN